MIGWEYLEQYLWEPALAHETFSVHEMADRMDEFTAEVTRLFSAYQDAQVRPYSCTAFVLYREPGTRTSNARWRAGYKLYDAKGISRSFADDTRQRLMAFLTGSLRRLGRINLEADPVVDTLLHGITDGVMVMLEGIVSNGDDIYNAV